MGKCLKGLICQHCPLHQRGLHWWSGERGSTPQAIGLSEIFWTWATAIILSIWMVKSEQWSLTIIFWGIPIFKQTHIQRFCVSNGSFRSGAFNNHGRYSQFGQSLLRACYLQSWGVLDSVPKSKRHLCNLYRTCTAAVLRLHSTLHVSWLVWIVYNESQTWSKTFLNWFRCIRSWINAHKPYSLLWELLLHFNNKTFFNGNFNKFIHE